MHQGRTQKFLVLVLYSSISDTVVSTDAFLYELGTVMMQKQPNHQWKSIVYASQSLTTTEEKYVQIQREARGML